MLGEVAIFWAVLFGFLAADNFVLLPAGGDCVRYGWRGSLRYDPALRIQMRGRDLVLLNPFNPFERLVRTDRVTGELSPSLWRHVSRQTRRALPVLNALSLLGAIYLVVLCALLVLSAWIPFLSVLLTLMGMHLVAWGVAAVQLARGRHALELMTGRTWVLCLEALFVPAYVVNLAKRVGYGQVWPLPALGLGMRQGLRMPSGSDRELYTYRMRNRLKDLLDECDEQVPATPLPPAQQWAAKALQCLKTSEL